MKADEIWIRNITGQEVKIIQIDWVENGRDEWVVFENIHEPKDNEYSVEGLLAMWRKDFIKSYHRKINA